MTVPYGVARKQLTAIAVDDTTDDPIVDLFLPIAAPPGPVGYLAQPREHDEAHADQPPTDAVYDAARLRPPPASPFEVLPDYAPPKPGALQEVTDRQIADPRLGGRVLIARNEDIREFDESEGVLMFDLQKRRREYQVTIEQEMKRGPERKLFDTETIKQLAVRTYGRVDEVGLGGVGKWQLSVGREASATRLTTPASTPPRRRRRAPPRACRCSRRDRSRAARTRRGRRPA
jgi:hypothetical protein